MAIVVHGCLGGGRGGGGGGHNDGVRGESHAVLASAGERPHDGGRESLVLLLGQSCVGAGSAVGVTNSCRNIHRHCPLVVGGRGRWGRATIVAVDKHIKAVVALRGGLRFANRKEIAIVDRLRIGCGRVTVEAAQQHRQLLAHLVATIVADDHWVGLVGGCVAQ